ncbi:DNA-processing protein DprA [bacterium]|nr:DNA-processing protein DprA [bacterium]
MFKIKIEDKNYPKLLKEILEAPKEIYVEGKIFPKENCFAIVGTRKCSSYGKEIALEITGKLVKAGLTIVSGLAPGIDTFAHKTAIEYKGRTIAVLGTGLDRKSFYPKENLGLAKKIVESGGCLISEYPPGTPGSKITFPKRNRIISGLSLGVLIIEAKRKSGALITAHWAKKQGRKIFAVPGSVYSPTSKGCHYLIKKGAKLVESAEDILKELKLRNLRKLRFESKEEFNTEQERLILEVLREHSLFIDKIIEKTGLPSQKVISTLAELEIQGKVKNLGGNIYALKR